jgi:hypothetical protein
MDFDQMLETWRSQNTAPPYDVNRDALRQALQTEVASGRRALRRGRRAFWVGWIVGTGLAVFAGFWIAITITNGWPAKYAIAAGVSFGMFALGGGAMWMVRGRQAEPQRNFGKTLEDEVRRSLALIDDQLSAIRRWTLSMLGWASIAVGTGVFSWTMNESQGIPESNPHGWFWYTFVLSVFFVWVTYRGHVVMRKLKAKLEVRQRRLRELLAALEARE